MNDAIGPIALVSLVMLGFALFWARQMAYRQRLTVTDDAVKLILSIAATECIVLGFVGAIVHSLSVLAPIGLVIAAGVSIMLVTRYRATERRSLLRCLSLAAQKGVPMNEAARAFARERSDELGLRAVRFAEAVEAGMSLPQALAQSGTRLPVDALLAIRVGYETSSLSASLERIARHDPELDLLIRSVLEKTLYIAWLWLALFGAMTFMMIKIVPVHVRMYREFGLDLPEITQWLIDGWEVADPLARYLASQFELEFPVLPTLLIITLLIPSCLGALYYIDLLPAGAPIVSRLRLRIDSSLVMRTLALAVNQQWSMPKTIWMLSRVYPSGPVRGRLATAGNRINNGEDWCQSLYKSGLLRLPEVAVLHSAGRVGNLEWALDEMSDSSLRRLLYRLRLAVNFLFPTTLFLFGLLVAFVVVSLFVPLVSLIQQMAIQSAAV